MAQYAPWRQRRSSCAIAILVSANPSFRRPLENSRRATARRAGAVVHSGPSALTTVIVRGRPNAQQVAGRDGGLKLMEIGRLRQKGWRKTVLAERQFWRLAARRS